MYSESSERGIHRNQSPTNDHESMLLHDKVRRDMGGTNAPTRQGRGWRRSQRSWSPAGSLPSARGTWGPGYTAARSTSPSTAAPSPRAPSPIVGAPVRCQQNSSRIGGGGGTEGLLTHCLLRSLLCTVTIIDPVFE